MTKAIPTWITYHKKWTPTTIDCYNLNSDCNRCSIPKKYKSLSHGCEIYQIIPYLLDTYGKPDK